jgi:hypothetical protein
VDNPITTYTSYPELSLAIRLGNNQVQKNVIVLIPRK